MSRLVLVLGGARSGKSAYAAELAAGRKRVVYFATAIPGDEEMAERIGRHRRERSPSWITIETHGALPTAVLTEMIGAEVGIIDCLTIHVANLLESGSGEREIVEDAAALTEAAGKTEGTLIVVSNEVGEGIVPDNALARAYRDVLGKYNQVVASKADEVHLMVAGIPVRIK